MKRISSLLVGASLALLASASIAASVTSLDGNWTCTTNASSSSIASEQAADKEMSETPKAAAEAFSFAAKNCRDCTKITCETK